MQATLLELARLVNGGILGEGTKVIRSAQPVHLASEDAITFLEDPKSKSLLEKSHAGAAVVPLSFSEAEGKSLIQVENVTLAFNTIASFFRPPRTKMISGISPQASVAESARIGEMTAIGPGAYIGNQVVIGNRCTIYPNTVILDGTVVGDETVIYPNVTVYENCSIGARCILHAGAVIGSYGFGYDSTSGRHILSVQFGNVVLGDDVDIGNGTTIDRGTYDSTFIGEGTKIDNLVQIGHNCSIGRHNLICAHTGVAGSTVTGDYVVMAGRVGVRDHLKIGDRAVIGAMAGVMIDVPPGSRIVGIPATPEKEQMKKQVALAKLPEMRKEFIALQKDMASLKEQITLLRTQQSGNDSSR
ncbi:MAG: UDP-3-O-(3-hydroxymyristoyl)glucosamine N-acyltransferase [Thermoguttaceae bacterium]|jgi:UDP-3-O-[3-hydroxymyristoyl] glucosamine N-acyltransferase